MAEAIEAVTKMLDNYPNAKAVISDGYFGAACHILVKYPRQVALRCVKPTGVASTTKFVPTAADIIQWLEREQLPMRNAFDRERNTAEQFAQRDRDEAEAKAESPEHRRKVAERLVREAREAFARGDGLKSYLFVPTFVPRYREMCERAEREPPERAQYGHSLEDPNRAGIWVPVEWYRGRRGSADGPRNWQQATCEQVDAEREKFMAKYNLTRAQFDALPDQPDKPDYWQGVR